MLIKLNDLRLVLDEINKDHYGDTVNLIVEGDRYVAFKFESKSGQAKEARTFYARNNQEPIIYSFKTIRKKED